jgi:[ribosomal protein S18]-alanine N-acetyltransferase
MIKPIAIGTPSVADAEAIAAVHRACFDQGWEAAAVARLLRNTTVLCRVARSGSGIAGFALCRLAADECEVLCCAVHAGFRRKGMARTILQAAFDEAIHRGGCRAFLEVAADNAPARGLYAGLGFETVGRRLHYYRRSCGPAADALVMSRDL